MSILAKVPEEREELLHLIIDTQLKSCRSVALQKETGKNNIKTFWKSVLEKIGKLPCFQYYVFENKNNDLKNESKSLAFWENQYHFPVLMHYMSENTPSLVVGSFYWWQVILITANKLYFSVQNLTRARPLCDDSLLLAGSSMSKCNISIS